MSVLCKDTKLNASAAYLRPGFAFGGSCLPKDLRAITYRGVRLDVKMPLLQSVLPSNDEHLRRAIDASLAFGDDTIGIYGLAFKENTDDLRESPVITLIEQMIGKGRDLRIYDPHIRIDSIYGSNKQFLFSALPHISKLLAQDLPALLAESRRIIVTQKPPADDLAAIRASGLPLLDLTRIPNWHLTPDNCP
jgi:GDP-mannose 6-dehydrogenase